MVIPVYWRLRIYAPPTLGFKARFRCGSGTRPLERLWRYWFEPDGEAGNPFGNEQDRREAARFGYRRIGVTLVRACMVMSEKKF
jgi:hypothetical protein